LVLFYPMATSPTKPDAAAEPELESIEAGDATYSVKLDGTRVGRPEGLSEDGQESAPVTFEGPLDLLLHLCQKHELDILNIPIAFVTAKYLEYLAVMQLMNLDIASEYLLMAATLAHIKSKMLLPAPPPGQEDDLTEEEIDPRAALIRRLLEYQKYKQAAADLTSRGLAGRDVFLRGSTIEEAVHTGLPPLAEIPLYSLVEAFQRVLERSRVKLSHDIVADRISITDRIHELVDVMKGRQRVTFDDLFSGLETRFDLVITFLALLEMTRLRMTRLHQSDAYSPLYVEMRATDVEVPADAELAFAPPAPKEETIEEAPPAEAPLEDSPTDPASTPEEAT